ncbi:Uncharacterized protein dnm_051450 [Desulfonema magnum]|uniref:Uncharacterized protein n=1 Tax=Desulfonema magnum TaxID=45655 RepID=A0A975GPQ4_9BACT|nr:Uncharacterized protein dnm_051450 [Desulfonema magnum]
MPGGEKPGFFMNILFFQRLANFENPGFLYENLFMPGGEKPGFFMNILFFQRLEK